MKKDILRGFDYTPLFMFLLSKVDKEWHPTLKEAQNRLDDMSMIYHMVALNEESKKPYFRSGESTFYSGLYVDDEGILRKVDPSLSNEHIYPYCACCTHTFNGKPLIRKTPLPAPQRPEE